MLDQREESKGTVARPSHQYRLLPFTHHNFHVTETFTHRTQFIALSFEQLAVRLPRGVQGFECVVKKVDIAGDPPAPGQKVERNTSCHVGFALFETVGRYEPADGLLESGESHWYNCPALQNASRSPYRRM